jgi:hypothetical protein
MPLLDFETAVNKETNVRLRCFVFERTPLNVAKSSKMIFSAKFRDKTGQTGKSIYYDQLAKQFDSLLLEHGVYDIVNAQVVYNPHRDRRNEPLYELKFLVNSRVIPVPRCVSFNNIAIEGNKQILPIEQLRLNRQVGGNVCFYAVVDSIAEKRPTKSRYGDYLEVRDVVLVVEAESDLGDSVSQLHISSFERKINMCLWEKMADNLKFKVGDSLLVLDSLINLYQCVASINTNKSTTFIINPFTSRANNLKRQWLILHDQADKIGDLFKEEEE